MSAIRFVVYLLLTVLPLGTAMAQEYVIHFSHVVTDDTPKGRAAKLLAERVNQRLAGRVKMLVFPDAQLYDGTTVLEALTLSSGTTGIMAAPSLSKFTGLSHTLQLFDLPFLFRDMSDVHRLIDSELATDMTAALRDKGIHALGFWDNGMKVFSVRGEAPLRSLQEFKGKRFRIQQSNIHAAMISALGGEPVAMPYQGLYTELARETVQGQENTWSNIQSKQLYEVQNYFTRSHHSYLGYLLVVGQRFWEGLPAELRRELEAIIREVTIEERQFAAADILSGEAAVAAAIGADHIVSLTTDELAAWKVATQSVEQDYADEIGSDLLRKVHELLGY